MAINKPDRDTRMEYLHRAIFWALVALFASLELASGKADNALSAGAGTLGPAPLGKAFTDFVRVFYTLALLALRLVAVVAAASNFVKSSCRL